MTTQISDVVVPEVFARYMMRETEERARIFRGGLLQSNAVISSFLGGGGQTVNLPGWRDLSGDENISSDNPASEATPLSVSAVEDIAIRHNRNQGWSAADLVSAFAGDDPLAMVTTRVATYWANQLEKMFVSSIEGILADSVANHNSDLVNDISGGNEISAEAIIDTAALMGDADDRLAVIVMHSQVYAQLAKLNLIDFIPDARGEVNMPTYLGYGVIRDDDCTRVANTGPTLDTCTTYLVARDAFAWGESPARVPVEIDRKPRQGDGGGTEELWTRRQFVLHPYGYQFILTGMAGKSPTNDELKLAAHWTRVAPERKQIGVAALISDLAVSSG